MKKKRLIFILICSSFLFSQLPSHCQDLKSVQEKYFLTGLRANYGFIIAHSKDIEKVAETNPIGLQADFSWHFNTYKAFQYCNCLPRLGVSVYYWDYQKENILGRSVAVVGFAEPFFNIHKRFNFSVRPGFGLAYQTAPYDSISNPHNLAYSTKFGYFLLLNVTFYYRLTDQFILNAAINYNHISNGGVKMPNKGLNYPTISLGFDYAIQPLSFTRYSLSTDTVKKTNKFLLAGLLGFKGLVIDDKTYLVYGILSKYLFNIGRRSYLSAGLEFDIDQSKIKLSEIYKSINPNAKYILSFTSGYEHAIGKFGLTFDLGVYLRNPDQGEDFLFQRYGVKYHFTRTLFMGLNLKAHRHYAEFFDIRLGIALP